MANRLSTRDRFLLFGLVALGVSFRASQLARKPLWVDEAESSINALTILQHGVPTNSYLGLPTYENTLTLATPDSPEYEFRDSSYSSSGLAAYHSWLPLYAIATAIKVFGIEPDESALHVQHDAAARRWRTIAVRFPAVIFGGVGLIFLFFTGLLLTGRETAWAALVAGVFSSALIDIDSQARYYSLTVMLSVVCCFIAWKALRSLQWSHYLWAALPFTLLFHTHLLTFLAIAVAFGVMALTEVRKHRDIFWKLCAFGAIVSAFTLPWMMAVGFFERHVSPPRAWPMLNLPQDLLLYPLQKNAYAILFTLGAVGLGTLFLIRKRMRPSYRSYLQTVKAPVLFLSVLMLAGYSAFLLLIPAASFFFNRLSLSLMGPGVLLMAILFSVAARRMSPRHSEWIAPLLMVLFMGLADRLRPMVSAAAAQAQWRDLNTAISYLNHYPVTSRTRIYATPNDHLTLTYYTGLAIQSIAPVRREFLTKYPGEIIFMQRREPSARDDSALGWLRIQSVFQIPNKDARHLSFILSTYEYRQLLAGRVQSVDPALAPFPERGRPLLDEYRQERAKREDRLAIQSDRLPIFRHYPVRTWTAWWQVFFYRFVDPASRQGDRANYAERLRTAHAVLLQDSTWTIFEAPALNTSRVPLAVEALKDRVAQAYSSQLSGAGQVPR